MLSLHTHHHSSARRCRSGPTLRRIEGRGRASLVATALALALVATIAACGAEPGGDVETAHGQQLPHGTFGDGARADTATTLPDLAACATATASAKATPVYLVFMFDRSGSMVGGRWEACKGATEAFLEAPESAGISASLHYFPIMGLLFPSCDPARYAKPAVPMTALPSGAFRSSLEAQEPDGSTPTGVALAGALAYAKELQAGQAKDGKVAIVLVSDGDPEGCGDDANTVAEIVASARGRGPGLEIPTYAIGLGNVSSLEAVAQAGGTGHAFVVPADDPAQLKDELQRAITSIKSDALACDYAVPPAPSGETLDRGKVNVTHTPTGGREAALRYNPTCAGGTGWRFDDEAAPSRILLCDASCETVEAQPGRIDVVFGCETQVADVK